MSLADLDSIERQLLEALDEQGTITISPDNTLSLTQSLGVTTQEFAAAKNTLRAQGYLAEESDVFTGGAVVVRITEAGKALMARKPVTREPAGESPGLRATKKIKRWWEF